MIKFDRNNATMFDVITHVAKVANSPTMFGDRWRIIRASSHYRLMEIVMHVHDTEIWHEFGITFFQTTQRGLFCVGPCGTFEKRIQYFVDRLNGCKRDDEGNMS